MCWIGALAVSALAVWEEGLKEGTSKRQPPFSCFILILIHSRKAKKIDEMLYF